MAGRVRNFLFKIVTDVDKKGITSLTSSLSKLAGPAALGAVATALVKMTSDSLSSADAIGKMATNTGLSTTAVQQWTHAANLGGTSIDTLIAGQKRLTRVISDAGDGVTTAKRALDDLGLEYTDLAAKSPEEQMYAVADALATMEDDSKKAAVAQATLGRGAVSLLAIFGDAPGTFETTAKSIEDVVSEDKIRNAELFNDTMSDLHTSLAATKDEIILGIAPAMTEAANAIRFLTAQTTGGTSRWSVFKDVLVGTASELIFAGPVVRGLSTEMKKLDEETRASTANTIAHKAAMELTTTEWEAAYGAIHTLSGEEAQYNDILGTVNTNLTVNVEKRKELADAIEAEEDAVVEVTLKNIQLAGSYTSLGAAISATADEYYRLRDAKRVAEQIESHGGFFDPEQANQDYNRRRDNTANNRRDGGAGELQPGVF